jgi:hypothetical protein
MKIEAEISILKQKVDVLEKMGENSHIWTEFKMITDDIVKWKEEVTILRAKQNTLEKEIKELKNKAK